MQPLTLSELILAFINCAREKPLDQSALGRLAFWRDVLGTKSVLEITADDIDEALVALQRRGRLRPKRGQGGKAQATGKPLAGSTLNRYLTTFGEVFKFARRQRLIKRAHPSPLMGIERSPEPADPERYLRAEEVEKIINVARMIDRRWGRLVAMITVAYVTGIRVGKLKELRWESVNFKTRTIETAKNKNGDSLTAPINQACIDELKRLPQSADRAELVFRGKFADVAHDWRKLWNKACKMAGLPGRNFHQVRHGTGAALSRGNVNQSNIMAHMGHRTLAASRRYMHHNTEDRRAVCVKVFGD
jgi:integrase